MKKKNARGEEAGGVEGEEGAAEMQKTRLPILGRRWDERMYEFPG